MKKSVRVVTEQIRGLLDEIDQIEENRGGAFFEVRVVIADDGGCEIHQVHDSGTDRIFVDDVRALIASLERVAVQLEQEDDE